MADKKKKLLFNRQMRRIDELDQHIQEGLALEQADKELPMYDAADYTAEQIAAIDPKWFEPHGFNEQDAERTAYSNYSYWASTFKNFWRNRAARILIVALIAIIAFAFIQPLLPNQHDPVTINNDPETGMHLRNLAPCSEYWFGTNRSGPLGKGMGRHAHVHNNRPCGSAERSYIWRYNRHGMGLRKES